MNTGTLRGTGFTDPQKALLLFQHSRKRFYSALHNKPELPFFAKLVCATLFRLKMEIWALLQTFVSDSAGKNCERYIRGSRVVHSNTVVQITLFFGIFDLTRGPVLRPTKENQR